MPKNALTLEELERQMETSTAPPPVVTQRPLPDQSQAMTSRAEAMTGPPYQQMAGPSTLRHMYQNGGGGLPVQSPSPLPHAMRGMRPVTILQRPPGLDPLPVPGTPVYINHLEIEVFHSVRRVISGKIANG